jgi:hypothetical protein
MTRHPSDDALVQWLESGKPRRVGRHVEACDGCLARVEVVSDLDGGLVTTLESASAPPPDLHRRTAGGVQGRLAAEEALAAMLELFTIPWRAASALLDTQPLDTQPLDTQPIRPTRGPTGRTDDEEQADG